jgi:NAD(P)-dependent dehydrogenase (short-subunit alcohol dehydrogenase family)
MMREQFSLEGKAALVIGASNPIGRAIAVALAEAGADVGVTTTTPTQQEIVHAQSCSNEIWALNRKHFVHNMHAGDEADVEAVVRHTQTELGRLDILVNAQDLPFAKSTNETDYLEFRKVIDTMLGGAFLASKHAARVMLKHEWGRIINVASVLGERGLINGAAYCAAQAGVLNLTRALALEWARSGIKANAIGAGWTEGMGMIGGEEGRQQLQRYLPYKRLAKPEEIAGAAVYLASDTSDYLTGQVIWIEGGALSHV